MAELNLSPAARADLVDIRRVNMEQFGANVADAYFLGFDEAFSLLRLHPEAGPEQQGLGKGIRCLVHRKHRIFYLLKGEILLIVRIIYHARNAKRTLRS